MSLTSYCISCEPIFALMNSDAEIGTSLNIRHSVSISITMHQKQWESYAANVGTGFSKGKPKLIYPSCLHAPLPYERIFNINFHLKVAHEQNVTQDFVYIDL